MIGVFDSGYGGLPTLRALTGTLPEYDYVYLGDHLRAPYGPRSAEKIYQCTLEGVAYLFGQGCELVLLACNTAAANALRRIQQVVLPVKYPTRRVLGVLVPTVEQITGVEWKKRPASKFDGRQILKQTVVGVLATEATVRSAAYTHEIQKRRPDIEVIEQACPELAPLIERGAKEEEIRQMAKRYVDALFTRRGTVAPPISAALLGCTHYELIASWIAELLPHGVKLHQQSGMVAQALKDYLERHGDMKARLTANRQRTFLTTGNAEEVSRLGSKFFGSPIRFTTIQL